MRVLTAHPRALAAIAVTASLAAIALAAWTRLPDGTQLPVHWNAAGVADGYAAADQALFLPVAIAGASSATFALLPRIEPLQDRMAGSRALLDAAWTGLLALMALVEIVVAGPAFGLALPSTLVLAGVGVLLIAIGNALPKSRPGFFVGIRTPWTLIDTDNWIATHRVGARTMIAGGAIILVAALAPISGDARAAATIAALAIAVVPPVVYSWWYWHRRVRAS